MNVGVSLYLKAERIALYFNKKLGDMMLPSDFNKYDYYLKAVQSPEADCEFLLDVYERQRGGVPQVLREDFCGTFALCCEWVKQHKEAKAVGVDFDSEPLDYGRTRLMNQLTVAEAERILLLQKDVMSLDLPKADIIASLNFSYFGFKDRAKLLQYFRCCHASLEPRGLLVLDCFGGSEAQSANEQELEHDDFSYFWDQDSFSPVTHEAMFHIHFQRQGEAKRERVFSYDWRLWTIPELKDVLSEVGFKKLTVYWEGTDEEGDGSGIFSPTEVGEECESWIAYIVAEK